MCGLIGYSGNVPFDIDKLRLLFYANETRGKDSSGYYNHFLDIEAKERVYKELGKTSEKMLPTFNPVTTNLFIGHTRAKTKGAINKENAHPFLYNDVVGAHNGTLDNDDFILKTYKEKYPDHYPQNLTFDVDSKMIFYHLDKVKNYDIFSNLDGGTAAIWCNPNLDDNILYVYRNSERPLYYGTIEIADHISTYISSIEEALKAIGCQKTHPFVIESVYEINSGKVKKLNDIKISKLKDKTRVSTVTTNNYIKIKDDLVKDLIPFIKEHIHDTTGPLKGIELYYNPDIEVTSVSRDVINNKTFIVNQLKSGGEIKIPLLEETDTPKRFKDKDLVSFTYRSNYAPDYDIVSKNSQLCIMYMYIGGGRKIFPLSEDTVDKILEAFILEDSKKETDDNKDHSQNENDDNLKQNQDNIEIIKEEENNNSLSSEENEEDEGPILEISIKSLSDIISNSILFSKKVESGEFDKSEIINYQHELAMFVQNNDLENEMSENF